MSAVNARAVTGGTTVDPRIVRTRNDVLRTTLTVLIDEGWDAVTHAHVAASAGYSKATLYKHWPTRVDLIRAAFSQLREIPHHVPTGDLRADLIAEVATFRDAIEQQRLDRALGVLVDLIDTVPELAQVRTRLVTDGEQVVRELLGAQLSGAALDAATLMLVGAVLHSAMMHGRPPTDDVIAASVDLVLRSLPGATRRSARGARPTR